MNPSTAPSTDAGLQNASRWRNNGRRACFELQSGEGVPLASRGAHRRKAFETFLVALAPRGDAITQPVFLDGDLAIELMPRARFVFVCKVAPGFESRKSTRKKTGPAAIEPNRVPRKILQEPAVMTDNDKRGPRGFEFRLEPFDRRQIEMIGRLVKKQNIRLGREDAGSIIAIDRTQKRAKPDGFDDRGVRPLARMHARTRRRARREIPKNARRRTANTAERNLTAVMAVPHPGLWEKSAASIGSNGSTS
jgi:hypothetical protein